MHTLYVHVKVMGNTPARTIRIDDTTWAEWQARAKSADTDVTDLIRIAMSLQALEKKPTRAQLMRGLKDVLDYVKDIRSELDGLEDAALYALEVDH